MTKIPSPNGPNGRDARGRFTRGNRGGTGNPYAARVARLRVLIHEAVTDADLRKIVGVLVTRAKDGDLAAIREVLDRLVGKPGLATEPTHHEAERPAQVWITGPDDRREPPDRAA